MKKKIIFVTQALWIGGIETALTNLLNRLDQDKYDITCLILQDDQTMATRLPKTCRLLVSDRNHCVSFRKAYRFSRLSHLTEEASNPSRLHKAMMWAIPIVRWLDNRLYIAYVWNQMKHEHFDCCVIYSDVAAETAVRAIRADKYFLFYHHGTMRRVYHDVIGYRKSERIIAVSRNVEQALRRFRPEYAHKMTTIHNLSDVTGILQKSNTPVPEVFSGACIHIVSCGRIAREKGMDLAVEACAKLVAAGHRNIHWWIVGGGPAEAEVQKAIQTLHMDPYITMLGMKKNPYPYIRMADIYVQPSRAEAYGLTIIEALVLGKYVVSTDTDGARELLAGSTCGQLCDIHPDALAQAVHTAMLGKTNHRNDPLNIIQANNEKSLQALDALLGKD